MLEAGQTVSKASVAGSLLAAVRLNLWGLGATLLGLQASRVLGLYCSLHAGTQMTVDTPQPWLRGPSFLEQHACLCDADGSMD